MPSLLLLILRTQYIRNIFKTALPLSIFLSGFSIRQDLSTSSKVAHSKDQNNENFSLRNNRVHIVFLNNRPQSLRRLHQELKFALLQIHRKRRNAFPSQNYRQAQTTSQILLPMAQWQNLAMVKNDSFAHASRHGSYTVRSKAFDLDDRVCFHSCRRCYLLTLGLG